jgi:hypothetical protein
MIYKLLKASHLRTKQASSVLISYRYDDDYNEIPDGATAHDDVYIFKAFFRRFFNF